MKFVLIVLVALAACSNEPKNEQQHAAEAGISPQRPSETTATGHDGPFGISQGESLSDLGSTKQVGPGMFTVATVPQPYPDIEMYNVQNTPEHGTCFVKAISKDVASDSYGANIKSAVDKVKGDLEARYGKPSASYDFLHANSIWNEANEWLTGLSKDERSYAYTWEAPSKPDVKIWRNVKTIVVAAKSNGDTPYFTIDYEFLNTKECDNDLKKVAAKSL